MENLYPVLKLAYKSYLFDNSGKQSKLFATVSPGKTITIMQDSEPPDWFYEYVIAKIKKK